MPFDYKKEYKEFYLPKSVPALVDIPPMNFIAVRGQGDPNQEDGEYKAAMGLLYGIAFTIKMSKKTSHRMEGYFDYVVPPLEGLWYGAHGDEPDLSDKAAFRWISMIRLPDFVTRQEFDWAAGEASRKKGQDFSKVEFLTYQDGLCVQCMHLGPYDSEPETMEKLRAFALENGYAADHSEVRRHHEIYLSDPRKCGPERLRTVLRMPVRPAR